MENTTIQESTDITTTSIEVPTALWLSFRSKATLSGATAKQGVIEALRLWLASQPN